MANFREEQETPLQWQPIPDTNFLENLPPGQYLLRDANNLCSSFTLDGDERSLQPLKPATIPNQYFNNGGQNQTEHCLIEHAIKANIAAYNDKLENLHISNLQELNHHQDPELCRRLKNMNKFVQMGFTAFTPVHAGNDIISLSTAAATSLEQNATAECMKVEIMDVANADAMNKSSNGIETAVKECTPENSTRQTAMSFPPPGSEQAWRGSEDFQLQQPVENPVTKCNDENEGYEKIVLKTCRVYLCRLENELPAENVARLFRKRAISESNKIQDSKQNVKRRQKYYKTK